MLRAEIGSCSIRIDSVVINLDNLAASIAGASPSKRERQVLSFFDSAFAEFRTLEKAGSPQLDFRSLKPRLRPQIVAKEYLRGLPVQLLTRSFSPKAAVAIVVDDGGKFRFVDADEAQSWGVGFGTIEAAAIDNLAARSSGVPIDLTRKPNGVMGVVEARDGYDSARLLVPAFRRRLLATAGTPLRAAVPTRDALLVWTPGVEPDATMRAVVRRFYDQGPYPRTNEIFDLKVGSVTPI